MLRTITFYSVVLALLTFSAPAVHAEPLKVVVLEAPPLGFLDANKKPTGLYVEMVELVAAKAGVPITVTVTPLPRALDGTEDGTYDVLALVEMPKADAIAEKIAKLIGFDEVVIGGKGVTFANYEALKGKSFANLRGMNYDARFTADPDIKKVDANSYEMDVNMVVAGRVDGMAGPNLFLQSQIKKMGMKPEDFGSPFLLGVKWVYLYYSNKTKNGDIAQKLSAAADALREEKAFDPILAKFIQ